MKPEITDPLAQKFQESHGIPPAPDRVFYATGVLLDAEDFKAEQLYHRSRLAQVLRYLQGFGTVAGLRVDWMKPLKADDDPNFPQGREEELVVQPGLAIDRLGRLIEVPKCFCIRLERWFNNQTKADLVAGFHNAPYNGVIVDVFIRFVPDERGKTPAFAAGPFDALDAVTPSRIRDGYKIELVIRKEAEPSLPFQQDAPSDQLENLFQSVSGVQRQSRLNQSQKALQDAILAGWKEGTEEWDKDKNRLIPLAEHAAGQDTTSLFLARVVLPATKNNSGQVERKLVEQILPDNHSRQFVYATPALARWLGI